VDFKLTIALIIAKISALVLKIGGSGATAAPGLVALKVDPELVAKLACQLDKNILVSGTNGKTTTTRMVSTILSQAKISHLHNRAGSNLLRGLASTLCQTSSIVGKIPAGLVGLWETDEAVFSIACAQLKPQIVLLTNLFRDQLDRYGEIDTVAAGWKKALVKLPRNTQVILNADDATVANLGSSLKAKVVYFGISDKNLDGRLPDHASDATVCPRCLSALSYKQCFVGHLGIYSCPHCGQIQPIKNVSLVKASKKEVSISAFGQNIKINNNLPGNYNLYNLTAAVTLVKILNIDNKTIVQGLADFIPAFGRVEKIKVNNKTLHLFLVKNPTGFNEVINTLILSQTKLTCLIIINDLIADGKDVSWLWDVNFEKLTPKLKSVVVSGIRAYDMALRLKYSAETIRLSNNLITEPDLKKAIERLLNTNDKNLYLLPTYTAMLKTRKILNRMGLVKSTWKD
jgi:UDP-N-acetylmuramyl tripeptide synthase